MLGSEHDCAQALTAFLPRRAPRASALPTLCIRWQSLFQKDGNKGPTQINHCTAAGLEISQYWARQWQGGPTCTKPKPSGAPKQGGSEHTCATAETACQQAHSFAFLLWVFNVLVKLCSGSCND